MDYDKVMQALRNADAAGDAQAARRLAAIATNLRQAAPEVEVIGSDKDPSVPGNEAPAPPPERPKPSMLERAKGVGEASLSVGTGLIGTLGGNVAGVIEGFKPSNYGTREGGERARQRAGEFARTFTYQPRTEAGQDYLQDVGSAISASKIEGLGPTVPLSAIPAMRKPRISYSDFKAQQAPVSQPYTAAQAKADGYVTTLRQARPDSVVADVIEGAAGSAKMEKGASLKNQKNTNRHIAEDVGLDATKRLTDAALEEVIRKEGAAYQAVKKSGVTLRATEEFKQAIEKLGGDFKAATAELPGLVDNPKVDALIKSLRVEEMSPTAAIEAVKYLRSQATKNLKAGFADPDKASLGMAQKGAAAALDDLIEANLDAAGKGQLARQYEAARVRIAKAHTAMAALNDATGNIDAAMIAKIADRKQLSGGMEKVANFAKSFSGSARNVDKMKDAPNFSLADLALGLGSGAATQNYFALAAMGARPAVRQIALSRLGQMAVPSLEEAAQMSPQTARMRLIKLSELVTEKAANDPNINALITVLANRAEQGR